MTTKRPTSQPARETSRKGSGPAVQSVLTIDRKPTRRTVEARLISLQTANPVVYGEVQLLAIAIKDAILLTRGSFRDAGDLHVSTFSDQLVGAGFRAVIDGETNTPHTDPTDAMGAALQAAAAAGVPWTWAETLQNSTLTDVVAAAPRYAEIIRKAARKRLYLAALDKAKEEAENGRVDLALIDAFDEDTRNAIRATMADSLPPWFKPVTVADIEARPLIRRDWFLDQTIKAGDKVEIIGPSKLGKSWYCLALASHLAAGMPFLGIAVPRPRRVLYFNLEIRDEDLQVRFQGEEGNPRSLWDLYGLDPALRKNLNIVSCRGHGQELRTMLEEGTIPVAGHDIVIIDPRYKLARPNEDENSAMGLAPLLTAFDRLAERGPAVIYIGHDPKGTPGDRSMTDRGAGSSIAARDYDTRITLTPHKDFDDDNRLAVVSFSTRSSAAPNDRTICYEHPIIRYERDIEPTPQTQYTKAEKVRAARSDQPPRCVEAVRQMLKTEPNGLSKNTIAQRGISANLGSLSAMRTAVDWLTAHGEITSEKGARFNANIYKLTVVNS